MAEKNTTYPQHVTFQQRFVSPLDNPRSFDNHYTEIATTGTSGDLYDCMSGYWGYIHQVLVCEYSGTAGRIAIADQGNITLNHGRVTPWVPVDANTCVALQWCQCPLGPFQRSGNYGNAGGISYMTDGAFYGGITLIVQIDPRMKE